MLLRACFKLRSCFNIAAIFGLQSFACAQFVANFSANTTNGCLGTPIVFSDLSTPSGSVLNWTWDFGDGNSSSQPNPTHTYTLPGTYTVTLTVFNGSSSTDEVKFNYITVNPLPSPSFNVSTPPCTLPATVNISNTAPSGGFTYAWDFGNGNTSAVQNPSVVNYNTEGTYNIQLTVTNTATGCSNTATETVNVFNYTTAIAPINTPICAGTPVNFSSNSSPGTNSYNWSFGNGNSSSLANPSTVYSTPGSYTITLNSQNTLNNCGGTSQTTIEVIQPQIPSLSASILAGCNPQVVNFTNTSSFDGSFIWNFGNGETFQGTTPPPITYSMLPWDAPESLPSTSFNVFINSVDANGCSATTPYIQLITIYNLYPLFTPSVISGCEPLDVSFANNSYSANPNDPPNTWVWNFENGNTSTQENPQTTFTHGIYNVQYTVSTANGCSESNDATITAGVEPIIDISFVNDTICAKGVVDFTNNTYVDVDPQLEDIIYSWTLPGAGSGEFEPDSDPFLDIGWHTISLSANYLGCISDYTSIDSIFINGPIANFSVPSVYCDPEVPVAVAITNAAQYGLPTDSITVFWNISDGSSYEWNNETSWINETAILTHSFSSTGEFTIQQIVINHTSGCSDSISQSIIIVDYSIVINVIDDTICFGEPVLFSADYLSNTPMFITNYYYTIENIIQTPPTPISLTYFNQSAYIYPSTGLQTFTLNATNNFGCLAETQASVTVLENPQITVEGSVLAGCDPLSVQYEMNSDYTGLPIQNYAWSSGATQYDNNNSILNTTLTGIGEQIISLVITDSEGCVGVANTSTFITAPIVNFSFPEIICDNILVSSVNTSSNYESAQWTLNNNIISNNTNCDVITNYGQQENILSHNNTLTLTLIDSNGCQASQTHNFLVSTPSAGYAYSFSGANVNEEGEFTCPSVFTAFTNQSQSIGEITSYNWDFGNGNESILLNPNNTYVFPGTYTSSLLITDEFGCQDSVSFLNYLTIAGPSGVFYWNPLGTPCDPGYNFISEQLNDISTAIWHMGNGTSFSSLSGESYTYPFSGTFYPFVLATNDAGCEVVYYLDTITVFDGEINASFWASPDDVNWGEPSLIVNESTGGIGGIVSNNWSIVDTVFTNNQDQFNHLFNHTGTITIMLIVLDSLGCTDTAYYSVNVTDNLVFPNVFTPNGDGTNDVFRIKDNAYKSYEVVILNRWGNEMSRTQVVEDNYLWDGKTQQGDLATDGVYYYVIKGFLRDNSTREDHGFFHLISE